MTTSFNSKIQSSILICSVLMISACTFVKSGSTTAGAPGIPIEGSNPETPPVSTEEPQPASTARVTVRERQISPDSAQSPKPARTRITPKERYVNIRSAPSTEGKTIAVFKGGHSLHILETKDNWVKTQWSKNGIVKQGWLKKRFVEEYE
jgi:hypothetical protein